jgi:glucose/arabinose dehydrogenase
MINKIYILILFMLVVYACAPKEKNEKNSDLPSGDADNAGLTLPEGFGAQIVAENTGKARHIAVKQNGDLYVKLRSVDDEGYGIIALRDTNQDGIYDLKAGFADYGGTGLEFYKGFLYASSDTSVYRYPMDNESLLPVGPAEKIVTGLIDQNQHQAKPLAFDNDGHLYLHTGAPSNACMEKTRTPGSPGLDPCPQLEWHAGVWRYDAEKPMQHRTDGYHYATGIRHQVGLAWNHVSNDLYGVQHGRDQLDQFWPEYYTAEQNAELPSEEFLRIKDGDDYGWPYCYHDRFQNKKLLAPEYGGDGKAVGRCEGVETPILAFPAHMAPNDILFYTGDQFPERYKNGALIAFHGSWNRAPLEQEGYYVVFVPFKDGMPSGDWEVFADGFAGVEKIESPRDAKHRPMGLAQGPDGSLFISESVTGKIWRVAYCGNN